MVDDDAQALAGGLHEQHLDLRLGGGETLFDISLQMVGHGEKKAGERPLGNTAAGSPGDSDEDSTRAKDRRPVRALADTRPGPPGAGTSAAARSGPGGQ